ncbi:S8 family serine peptidase [Flavobacterium ardleyense]|uniref:S8 family serine peptidase n=1 Tax=Flavobacterium ardleyense TaxID=2038737 RepID=A0ABW5ZC79_9FLAO
MRKYYFFVVFLVATNILVAQKSSIDKVLSSYDLQYLKKLELSFKDKQVKELEKARFLANKFGYSADILTKNGVDQLVGLIGDDHLKYYSTDNNSTAANSTRTNYLNNNYNLFGAGLFVGVWDGGPMRIGHVEFGGRASIGDGMFALNENSFHATHVAGTIGASGINALAKGMAPQVNIKGFDWFNDISEVIAQARIGMLVSNHSYGVPVNKVPSWYAGAYTSESRDWDVIAFNMPYYLMVASAGNNGGDANAAPLATGYDKLTGNKVSKNNLVIANTQQASIDANGNLTAVNINSSSSQGPSDDRRIKPDIAGQGSSILSTGDSSNSSYLTLSGTSMSAPNVTGSIVLLQEYFEQKNNRYMKAATLKGLVCHTADDAGRPGPDAVYGWGLLNSKKAVETIFFNGLSTSIVENNINQNQTITYKYKATGAPFKATVCWTDPAGVAINGVLNGTTPALVNDLDVRITSAANESFFPWKLQSNPALNAVRDGDNNVDNVESVLIDAPTAGVEYTVTITHKGNLVNGLQNFSLIVSGIDSSFSLLPLNSDEELCSTASAVYSFDFKNATFAAVNLQATNLPAGASATFSSSSIAVQGVVTMTISNLGSVPSGEYFINLVATKGTEIKTVPVTLKVFNSNFGDVSLISPLNNSTSVASNTQFEWDVNPNATSYILQVSQDANFQSLFVNETVLSTSYLVNGLAPNQAFFWRVLPVNLCGQAPTSNEVNSFKTANIVCGANYLATDFSNSTIGTDGFAEAIVPIQITEDFVIADVSVNINISHSSVQELKVFLEGPASIGSPSILLIDQSCGDYADIVAEIKDGAGEINCNTSSTPAISGTFKPANTLATLNNKVVTGEWKLRVVDGFEADGGVINSFSLNFCKAEESLGLVGFNENLISFYPNPTSNQLNVVLRDSKFVSSNTTISVVDFQGRVVKTQKVQGEESVIDVSNLQSGVYMLRINALGASYTKKFVKK